MIYNILYKAGILIFLISPIIIRHDTNDQKYVELGSHYQKYISNLNLLEEVPDGMGTFIDSTWIITAAHCAEVIKEKMDSGLSHYIKFDENEYLVKQVRIHSDYWDDGAYDLALVQIDPIPQEIKIVPLYEASDELHQEVIVAGYGEFGTGITGPTTNDGQLRAGTNKVDEATGYWLKFIFDDPESENTTTLEAISGPGDSGGPAFLEKEGKLYLVGVGSGQSTAATGGKEGFYGVREYYVRVSKYISWIETNMK